MGNPETNDYYDSKGLLEYAWSHAVISDQLYYKSKQVCDFHLSDWSFDCLTNMAQVYTQYNQIDIYNIYAPSCLLNTTTSSPSNSKVSFVIKYQYFEKFMVLWFYGLGDESMMIELLLMTTIMVTNRSSNFKPKTVVTNYGFNYFKKL